MNFKNFIIYIKKNNKTVTYYLFKHVPIFKIQLDNNTRYIFKFLFFKFKIRKKRYSIAQNKPYEQGKAKIPTVINCEKTINELVNSQKSIIRYGDGEFNIINGNNIRFQEFDKNLKQELEQLLQIDDVNIMVAIPDAFSDLSKHNKSAQKFWQKYMVTHRANLYKKLDFNKTYYDAFISRSYLEYLNNKNHNVIFKNLKKIWQNKDIVLVEGEFSRLGYKNDLFESSKSIKRILCPAENAYNSIEKIIEACRTFSKDVLFIIALGPTATILGYKLHNLGYRALDLGHIDIDYEWFLKKATKKIAIKDKYVNEVKKGRVKTNINDAEYNSQVYYRISN